MNFSHPEKVLPENHRFFIITQWAFIIGSTGHLFLGYSFVLFKVPEMVWFNFLFSVPAFTVAFFLNRQGWHNFAFTLAYTELLLHQTVGIYYVGWESGLQYWLVYLAALSFFNALWKTAVRAAALSIVATTFLVLYLFCRTSHPYTLTGDQYALLYTSSSLGALVLLALLINYYVQAASRAEENLSLANRQLSEKNIQIEHALSARNQALDLVNKELSEAAEYVKTILPQPVSTGPIRIDWRFIPSTSLGGDAFGYHWLEDGLFAIYLIDVSGHGVGAALLSVSVMNSLRSQSLPDTDFKDPSSVLNALNKAFPGEDNNDMFFTIWYGVYNTLSRKLVYASAGHPPALLLNPAAAAEESPAGLRTKNYVVGGLQDIEYQKAEATLDLGSSLYIFSDGVYEVEKPDGFEDDFTILEATFI